MTMQMRNRRWEATEGDGVMQLEGGHAQMRPAATLVRTSARILLSVVSTRVGDDKWTGGDVMKGKYSLAVTEVLGKATVVTELGV